MSVLWAAVPLVGLGSLATTAPPAAEVVAENQFVATCVDLGADDIEAASVCIVGLDGSITLRVRGVADGFVPGQQLALSGDRTRIAAASSDEVLVIDAGGRTVATVPIAGADGLAWTPDGEAVLVQMIGATEWSIMRFEIEEPDEGDEVTAGPVDAESARPGITVSPDGTTLLYTDAADHGTLMAVDLASGAVAQLDQWEEPISVPDISPDGELVALAVADRIEVVDLATGELVHAVETDRAVTTPSFSPDGSQLMYVEDRGAVEYQDLTGEGSTRVVVDITDGDDAANFPALPTWS